MVTGSTNVMDDEQVVFTAMHGADGASGASGMVHHAVERWEQELAATQLGLSLLRNKSKKSPSATMLSIDLDTTNDNDNDEDHDENFERKLESLTRSEQFTATELHRISPTHSSHSDEVHDQLPNVEEYKTDQCHHRPESRGFSLFRNDHRPSSFEDRSSRRPDPPSDGFTMTSRSASKRDLDLQQELSSNLLMIRMDSLSTSEREGRLSQLPENLLKDNTYIHSSVDDPEDAWTGSERGPWLSELPVPKDLLRQSSRSRVWKIGLALSCLALIGLAILLPLLLRDDDDDRTETVIEFLVVQGISARFALYDTDSPQFRAAHWVADQDRARLSINDPQFLFRYVLAVLYFGLGGTETWPDDLQFLSPYHVCQWTKDRPTDRVSTQTSSIALGVHGCRRDDQNNLIPVGIALPFHGLYGQLPEEIRHLDQLEALILQFNPAMGGSLPSAIAGLSNLRTLSLEHCSLGGRIPDWIGSMTQLTRLGLGDNRFTGVVPASLALLTNLQSLSLDDNHLSAQMTVFQPLSNLRTLYLDDNQITGTLNDAYFANWTVLRELDLSENRISGTLPSDLFTRMSTLKVVDLHANRLTGLLPSVDGVEANVHLQFLALHANELEGAIPPSFAALRALQHLDLSMNALTGTIPESFSTMINLRSLFLGDNNLGAGTLPKFLPFLSSLEELSLRNSGLVGTLPNSIGYLTNLRFLDLSQNFLIGTLPEMVGLLSLLDHLLLKENQFTGQLPEEMKLLTSLDVLLLEGNPLTGSADSICMALGSTNTNTNQPTDMNISFFASDCGGNATKFSCSCCTLCCVEGDWNCNEANWGGNLDGKWEYDYKRHKYSFGDGISFQP